MSISYFDQLNQDSIMRLVLDDIVTERHLQDIKWGAPCLTNPDRWNTILVEEVGEVSNAINEKDWDNLKKELVQVAAVAVAWLESIERFGV